MSLATNQSLANAYIHLSVKRTKEKVAEELRNGGGHG